MEKNTVIWTGSLQPTSLSKGYTVEIAYSLDMQQPEVIVLNPSLQKEGRKNPACLSVTSYAFSSQKERMDEANVHFETIVPWASLWLYYYEVWHATGEWLGGGEHPIARKKQKNL